ncbi:MAG: hypothetical protein ABI185_04580 [Ginsengibacter sp.]
MKKLFVSPIIAIVITFFLLNSCEKNKNIDTGCGCNTDSVWYYATYDNFGGYSYNAWLLYVTQNNQNAWFMSVEIPNGNFGAICKICNPDLPAIKAFTDTSSRKVGIPVHFAGKLKQLCANENWGFVTLPETILAHIAIDSLQKK